MPPVSFPGRIARYFLTSKLTPAIVAAICAWGLLAIFFTPREENPQITMPSATIVTQYPGASSAPCAPMPSASKVVGWWSLCSRPKRRSRRPGSRRACRRARHTRSPSSQLGPSLGKRTGSAFEVVAAVGGGHLDADARLSMGTTG